MRSYLITNVLLLIYISFSRGSREDQLTFPEGFLIGASTAAYQIEGGWNSSDKGENEWDRFTHAKPDRILDKSNGDVACDSYHKYKEDVKWLKHLGMDVYRFSISWTRILPTGYANVVSKDGVKYYHNVLDELEKHNITPMVTISHFDHPQIFQDMGGWTNALMVELFADYARVIYKEFGDRVKLFVTFNDPNYVCVSPVMPNEQGKPLFAKYLCSLNILKAHARAYHIYDDEFRAVQKGQVGIILDAANYVSKHENDKVSDNVAFQNHLGLYAHPIFSKEGGWPPVMEERIAENSRFEKLPRSRLPSFSNESIAYIKGSADFMGINHYTTNYAEPAPKSNRTVYENDDGLIYSVDEKWPTSAATWLRVVPEGFLSILRKIKEEYDNPVMYITENGYADNGEVQDNKRLKYLYSYMKFMLTAIHEYGCNVRGYMVWSLMDNFEWTDGYTVKFGVVQVDFSSANRTRTLKKSASWLKKTIGSRRLLPVPEDI